MKRVALIVCAALHLAACGTTYDKMEEAYQRDMDPVRVRHIQYLAAHITEFFQKTGRMPLADRLRDKGIVVFITHRAVNPGILEQAARLPIVVMSTSDLKIDLEKGLGRTIDLPSDPQNFASYAPNLYIYDVNTGRACVYGHLFFEAPGAQLVEGNATGTGKVQKYYKYERCMRSKA